MLGEDGQGTTEVTPEQKAEILGETPPSSSAGEGEKKESSEPDSKGGKDPATPSGELPKGDDDLAFSPAQQARIDKIIQERLDRDRKSRSVPEDVDRELKEYREIMREIAKGKAPKEEPRGPQMPKHVDDVQDVGEFLGDPDYRGWSMAKLKADHPDHYRLVKFAVQNKLDMVQTLQQLTHRQESTEADKKYESWLVGQVEELRKHLGDKAGDFFDTASGKLNFRFRKEIDEWAQQHGIFNPLLAYRLKAPDGKVRTHFMTDDELKTHTEKAVTEALKKIGKDTTPPPRVDGKDTKVKAESVSDAMSDEDLMKIYADEKPGWEEARKILGKRGRI